MQTPLYIDVAGAVAGAALARALQRRGLAAALVPSGVRWQVQIECADEDTRSFLADVGVALAAWSGGERERTRVVDA